LTGNIDTTSGEFVDEPRRLGDRIALWILHGSNEQALSVAGGSDVEETTLLCQAGGDVADGSIGINIVVEEIDKIFLPEDGASLS